MKKSFESLEATVPTMQHIAKLFCDPESEQPNAFNEVLFFLSAEVTEKSTDFRTWLEKYLDIEIQIPSDICDSEAVMEFAEVSEQLMSAILIVVQKLNKHHSKDKADENDGKTTDEGNFTFAYYNVTFVS